MTSNTHDTSKPPKPTRPVQPSPPAQSYPFGPYQRLEMHPRYEQLRRDEPVARVRMPYGGEAWLVTRYADVKTVKTDPRFSRAPAAGRDVPRLGSVMSLGRQSSILVTQGAEHSRLRKLVAQAFTAHRVAALRPRVQHIVDSLLDTMTAAGQPAELIEALARPLPITVICELLGVPSADRDAFGAWADQIQSLSGPEQIQQATDRLDTYTAELIARRRAEPTDDLLGALVSARDQDDRLSEPELVTFGTTLLVAGYETTANTLGNCMYTLLSRRALWRQLVADPDRVPQAVEELLRFLPLGVGAAFPVIATEDVELGGVTIRAGDAVLTVSQSANRDDAVFRHPNEIDFSRSGNPHLAFGHGPHHCLGASLARMELRVVLDTLLRRFPQLRLATRAEQIVWRTGHSMRRAVALPVTW